MYRRRCGHRTEQEKRPTVKEKATRRLQAVGVDNKDRGGRGKDFGSRQYISRRQSIRRERVDEPLKWRPIQRADNSDQVDNDDGQWPKGH